jgi:LysR family tcuABC transcriptional regulator
MQSKLFPNERSSITMEELSRLPLILPTSMHGLRRRVMAEFDQRGLAANVVAEIDSLSLLMECVYDGMGGTIKPMSVMLLEGRRGRRFRAVAISDADIVRQNHVYSIARDMQSPAAAAVEAEIRVIAKRLVEGGQWPGVRLLGEDTSDEAQVRPLQLVD